MLKVSVTLDVPEGTTRFDIRKWIHEALDRTGWYLPLKAGQHGVVKNDRGEAVGKWRVSR